MKLEQTLSLRQQQRLIMTPQMQQSIKLLQLSTLELLQLTRQEMLENPILEESDEVEPTKAEEEDKVETELEEKNEADDKANDKMEKDLEDLDTNWDVYFGEGGAYVPTTYANRETEKDVEDNDFLQNAVSVSEGLYEHLQWQLHVSALSDKKKKIGEYIIGNINEDGYLIVTIDEIKEAVGATEEEVKEILTIVQEFDPPGVAARNIQESILLQLRSNGNKDKDFENVLTNHFENLMKKHFSEISKATGIDANKVQRIFNEISKLEPKPGRQYSNESIRYIVPEVIVDKVDEKYMVYLNEDVAPTLRISPLYRRLLDANNKQSSEQEKDYLKGKLKSALWLIKNIEKRKKTILRVTEAIVDVQKEFFHKGIEHLKPLTLRVIADMVGVHESTVARVTTNKYVQTPRGIFELKFFFNSGLQTDTGESASSLTVKNKIRGLIEQEDQKKPLSDQKITQLLEKEGYKIARRTVAKYREQIKILPTHMRKSVKK